MSLIEAVHHDNLTPGPATPGLTRQVAFHEGGTRVIRSVGDPGNVSGWHHHGDYHVYGYVVSGSLRLENGPGGRESVSLGPGEFFHVPPRTVHREVNPSTKETVDVILFLQGAGDMVFNMGGPDAG